MLTSIGSAQGWSGKEVAVEQECQGISEGLRQPHHKDTVQKNRVSFKWRGFGARNLRA